MEKLPDDDPAGSKHVADVHNETKNNTIQWLFIKNLLC
jgi:hypothetical protein